MEVATTTDTATTTTTTAVTTDAALTARDAANPGERRTRRSPGRARAEHGFALIKVRAEHGFALIKVRAEHGFALLEVLVASAIAAIALGVLFHSGMGSLRAAQASAHYEQAVARARSHLTLAVHASPLAAGDWRGDDGGGFTWHLRVTPIGSATVRPVVALTLAGSSSFPLTLYAVSVSIGWHDGDTPRQVQLDTQQIGQAAR